MSVMKSNARETGNAEINQSTWAYLSWFQVQYLQRPEDNTLATVFRNGRQQVPVTILVQARNSENEVVLLPTQDLLNVKLVNYNTGLPWPSGVIVANFRYRNPTYDYFPEGLVMPESYKVSHDHVGSDHEVLANRPAVLRAKRIPVKTREVVSPDGAVIQLQEFELWLSVTTAETLRVAAALESSVGVFHTHSSEVAAGGAAHDGGLFNSSIRVTPVAPRSFTTEYFSKTQHEGNSTSHISVLMYDLWLTDTKFKIRKAVAHHDTWEDGWYFARERGGDSPYHYAAPSHWTDFTHTAEEPSLGSVKVTVNERLETEGKANLVRILVLDTDWYHSEPQIGQMGYFDNYGNESIIYLREDAQGNGIRLDDS
jgi:hypothetical protein